MNLHVTKNIQFTRLAKSFDRQREFNFRKISGAVKDTFHVDTSDDRSYRIIFQMQKDETGHWKIVNTGLPTWVYDIEERLHELIEEEMKLQ
jgi:hypothetical protein